MSCYRCFFLLRLSPITSRLLVILFKQSLITKCTIRCYLLHILAVFNEYYNRNGIKLEYLRYGKSVSSIREEKIAVSSDIDDDLIQRPGDDSP